MQVGDLVRYTAHDMEHKEGVEVMGVLLYLTQNPYGAPLWGVRHLSPPPFAHKGCWKQPKDLEVLSASR